MPDLSPQSVQNYWRNYDDPLIYRVITFMESVETWTLDGEPEIEKNLMALGNRLDKLKDKDISEFGHEEEIIRISCNIKTGRAIRLLQILDQIHPGTASRLLTYAEEVSTKASDPAGIFLRRNIVFERLRLIGRVFAPERFNLIFKAMEEET